MTKPDYQSGNKAAHTTGGIKFKSESKYPDVTRKYIRLSVGFCLSRRTNSVECFLNKANFDDKRESNVDFTLHKYEKKLRGSWPRCFCWIEKESFDTNAFSLVIDKVIET